MIDSLVDCSWLREYVTNGGEAIVVVMVDMWWTSAVEGAVFDVVSLWIVSVRSTG